MGTALFVMMCLTPQVSQADLRPYLVTYGYYTPSKGEVEIEQWTESFGRKGGGSEYRSRTEFEFGITDRFAASVYAVNSKPKGRDWAYDQTNLEMRYRITEQGKRFWDTAGYVEFARPNDANEPTEMEIKGIFSHDFDSFNLTVNLIGERELARGAEIEKGYAIGISPHIRRRFNYSVELFGDEKKHYIMPGLWLRPGDKQNIGIGLAAGLTQESDKLQLRTLYALEF